MYRRIIDAHMDTLKQIPISSIRKTDVLMCLNAASGKVRTQEQILLTLKQVVKAAVTDKYIAPGIYLEIFYGIRIKKQRNTDKRPLTREEREAVFSAEFTNMQKAFVYIIYGCSLRRGKALALEHSDFDFEKKWKSVDFTRFCSAKKEPSPRLLCPQKQFFQCAARGSNPGHPD